MYICVSPPRFETAIFEEKFVFCDSKLVVFTFKFKVLAEISTLPLPADKVNVLLGFVYLIYDFSTGLIAFISPTKNPSVLLFPDVLTAIPDVALFCVNILRIVP